MDVKEFVDHMINGAALTAPSTGAYFRNKDNFLLELSTVSLDNVYSTCAKGAAFYSIMMESQEPIGESVCMIECDLENLFVDKYDDTIVNYNDEFGRDATIKACKELLNDD